MINGRTLTYEERRKAEQVIYVAKKELSYLYKTPVTIDVTPMHRPFSIDAIISLVCRQYQVSYEDMQSDSRKRQRVEARQMCAYLLAQVLKLTSYEIGDVIRRDRSTASVSISVIEGLLSVRDDITIKNKEAILKALYEDKG